MWNLTDEDRRFLEDRGFAPSGAVPNRWIKQVWIKPTNTSVAQYNLTVAWVQAQPKVNGGVLWQLAARAQPEMGSPFIYSDKFESVITTVVNARIGGLV